MIGQSNNKILPRLLGIACVFVVVLTLQNLARAQAEGPSRLTAKQPTTRYARQQPKSTFDASSVNSDQIVVLKHGDFLEGRVSYEPTKVIVSKGARGSRIFLSRDSVDFVCNSMAEAYWEKFARTKATDTAGQVDLFQWCLKHQLVDEAENQFDLLTQAKIKASELDTLYRQLLAVAAQRNRESKAAGRVSKNTLNPQTPSPLMPQPDSTETVVDQDAFSGIHNTGKTQVWNSPSVNVGTPNEFDGMTPSPRRDSNVRPVQFVSALPDRSQATTREIQDQIELLPQGVAAKFRRQVEPFLLQNCAKCHDKTKLETSNGFALIKSHQKMNPIGYSQRNLYVVLPLIDTNVTFQETRLWEIVTKPHAGNAKPFFAVGARESRMTANWLSTLTQPPSPAQFAAGQWESPIEQVKPVAAKPDRATQPGQELSTIGEIPSLETNGVRARGFVPADPFDPEIFNRKHK